VLLFAGGSGSPFAEGLGEGVAESFVVGLQLTDPVCGEFDAAQ
jgi:hypothetical protein